MSDGKVHVALVANMRYRPGLEATRHSMIAACRSPERLVFHEFGDADMERFLSRAGMADFNGSKLAYLRLFLPELLPDCEWVLYADVDTLWFRDPCELWDCRDDAHALCWVEDLPTTREECRRWCAARGVKFHRDWKYACSGVMLMNLAKWRRESLTERTVAFIRRHGCPPFADQDVLNLVLGGDARMLASDWDCVLPPGRKRACVLHICGLGRSFGENEYRGMVPQYALWSDYYRTEILRLPASATPYEGRFRLLAVVAYPLLPVLAAVGFLPLPYPAAMFVVRLRRQLGFARWRWGFEGKVGGQ